MPYVHEYELDEGNEGRRHCSVLVGVIKGIWCSIQNVVEASNELVIWRSCACEPLLDFGGWG